MTIWYLSHAETDLLALRSVVEDLPDGLGPVRMANPAARPEPPPVGAGDLLVVRLLGGRPSWDGFDDARARCRVAGVPFVALSGEVEPDGELAAASTVPAGIVAEAHRYVTAGGPENMAQLLRFLADTTLLGGFGFDPPRPLPAVVVWDGAGLGRPGVARDRGRPLVGVVFYRAHLVAGNTTFVADLCEAIEAAGGDALAVACYTLRPGPDGRVEALEVLEDAGIDALVTTVLAMGGSDGGDAEAWEVPQLARLGVPVVHAPSANRSAGEWRADEAGLTPLEVAAGVALPEFDGRIIAPAFAFKEVVDDGGDLGAPVIASRTVPDRTARVAGLAVAHARLRRVSPAERRVALVLSAYPTKRSRLGNAVGLDTPASALELLHALRDAGHRVDRIPATGDELMAELAAGLTYEEPVLSPAQVAGAAGGFPAGTYAAWFDGLPAGARDQVEAVWGPAPGEVYVHDGALRFPGLDLGGVLVTIQPPRGFGADPIGTYHAPDMPPPHHYLAFYRWLATRRQDGGWGAHAVVHAGKHGTLEWLPGKANALSAACFPDAALGDLPFVYPFVVNDPGEGTQAKRRVHATIVDHLPPPMTRAEAYGDLARLEQLLDAYAQAQAMDPAKLPALRTQVWELVTRADLHEDLGFAAADLPDEESFDEAVLAVDGYLCALKDAQIRGGLHILGRPPAAGQLVDTVLAITRLAQGDVPSLRTTALRGELGPWPGLPVAGPGGGAPPAVDALSRTEVDALDALCRSAVERLAADGWRARPGDPTVLRWVADTLVPALARTTDEVDAVLAALAGRYVPAGPSGAPTRGMAHVLPTGRNFYAVDPKGLPSPLAWEVGRQLAERLVERHVGEVGAAPRTVGLVLWGTAAMRTGGDDVAEALALLGVRPVWEEESRRVVGLEPIPLAELGRPRVDVTLRISGFFRDAFPHAVALLDDAVRLAASLRDEGPDQNPVAAAGDADPRLFGPPPGGYGSGVLALIESKAWRSDADLAEVYLAWSGFAYGRGRAGEPADAAMRRRFAAIDVAVKNQDNREHDIFDSDDYLQDHGGMVAAVRSLTGTAPLAWFGDSADPSDPKVRALSEEAARVVRSRVVNPRWIGAMQAHGYKGAFELAATVDYLFGYDATTGVVADWMYERVTEAYVADADMRKFFRASNPDALRSIAERLLEADQRGLWDASPEARAALEAAVLEAEGWEESR
ncbi:MAG TPA: cobaltochelatase subunit CobN [Acidimicrobiales bacterium]|nr:cobaltochelatase subunit CobN [Acidimicrobiales bacterium]